MGLSLTQAPFTALPQTLLDFFALAVTSRPRRIYRDGSFTICAQLLDVLSMSNSVLTYAHGKAATGVYLPPSQGAEALALIVRTRDRCLLSGVARYDHLDALIAAHTSVSLFGLLLCNP